MQSHLSHTYVMQNSTCSVSNQRSMTRVMTLIRMFFLGYVRDIARRLSEKVRPLTYYVYHTRVVLLYATLPSVHSLPFPPTLLYRWLTMFISIIVTQSVSHQLPLLLSERERRAASRSVQLVTYVCLCPSYPRWFTTVIHLNWISNLVY